MTTRLAPLPAPEGLRPALSGAAERSGGGARLASLPAPEGLRPALSGAAERSGGGARLASLPTPEGLRPARSGAAERSPAGGLTHLLYLHGFRSSPQSAKARWMADWVTAHRPDLAWACPQLPPSPAAALADIRAIVAGWPAASTGVIGSSLGGFYATIVAERLACRAVLMNPAVDPARDLAAHIGRQTMYHAQGESFDFRAEYVDELRAMAPPAPLMHPENILAIIAKGDEVLDWREMTARYAHGPMKLIAGSDHGLADFESHVPDLLRHLGLAS